MKASYILPAFLLLTASCGHKNSGSTSTDVPDIEVAHVVIDSVTLYKTYPGTLGANASVNIVARVDGTITSKRYQSGEPVRKGQVLFTIEDTPYRDAVVQAEAALATARSQYDYATRQRAAMEKALESDAVSEMEVLQARSNEREAAASIQNARAALSTARTNLDHCTITSPINGRASDIVLSVGNYVGGAGEPVTLCTVYDNSCMLAYFAIEDIDIVDDVNKALRNGGYDIPMKFSQKLAHSYNGKLLYVAPNMNNATGTLQLQALIDNPHDELRPGMYVEVSLPAGIDPNAMLVRDASLSTDQLGKYLYTVNDSNRVVYTPVKTGDMANDSMRIVTEGLDPSARYVTSAMLKMHDGMTVNPIVTR